MSEHLARGKSNDSPVIDLNVGGVFYSTSVETLSREPEGILAKLIADDSKLKVVKDGKGRYFIDRDGVLFRYILDYLRNLRLILPENFHEKERLRQEAEFYKLPNLIKMIASYSSFRCGPVPRLQPLESDQMHQVTYGNKHIVNSESALGPSSTNVLAPDSITSSAESTTPSPNGDNRPLGCITIGYRGTFAFGRDGLADVKFRKLSRIIVCGKVSLCREVFKDTLNESRDPDRGDNDRYTSRFFLKHSFLEQAFDMLQEGGFVLVASCGSGTNSAGEVKPGLDTEESKWQHYNEFIFSRR